jgi:DNA modification methylase
MSKITFLLGDCLEQLKTLPDNSVHTCITSPPYFNLRDYATATWEGGDPACDHVESIHKHGGERADRDQTSQVFQFITVCEKCGAVRVDKQIGLEETPEEYVDKLVQVFREVKRVLRDDGTLWLNIGDTYATSTKTCGRNDTERLYGVEDHPLSHHNDKKISHGLKNKDLIGIPWRLAFALQADGFYLRQDLVWSKPNPMPESVTDRCTKSHEYIFLLTKSPTYYFDHIAIREDSVDFEKSAKRYESSFGGAKNVYLKESGQVQTKPIGNREFDGKRNKRSVWEITPKPFKEAHFAVYPPDLIEPCVLAGTSEHGCCSKCGAPYQRVVEKKRIRRNELEKDDPRYRPNTYEGAYEDINGKGDAGYSEVTTKGWEPTCDCHADIVPCTVLDPFMGSGTTGLVAKKNLRSFVGIELSPEYMEIAKRRINKSVTQLDLFGRGIGV